MVILLEEKKTYKRRTKKNDVPQRYLAYLEETGFTGLLEVVIVLRNSVFDIRMIIVKGFIVYLSLYIKNQSFWGDDAKKIIKKTGIFRERAEFWIDIFPMNYEDIIIELSNLGEGLLSTPQPITALCSQD